METIMENNVNTEKGLWSPIQINPMPAPIQQLLQASNRNSETKLYLMLYITANGECMFKQATGRMACYEAIASIMDMYPDVDVNDSVVLVEVPAVNRDGGAEWMLKHIDKAPTFYQFCKKYECLFPNIDFHIDDYLVNEGVNVEEESSTDDVAPPYDVSAVTDNSLIGVYSDIMKEKEESDKDGKSSEEE